MYTKTEIEKSLINKINEILNDYEGFEQPFKNYNGDIVIKKINKRKTNDTSILTNIFREMIKNDVKKNRVENPVSYLIELMGYQDTNFTRDCSDKFKTLKKPFS